MLGSSNRERQHLANQSTDAQITWGCLRDDALSVAAGLHAAGLRPALYTPTASTRRTPPTISPVVMIHLTNCLEIVTLLLGTFAAGLTATTAGAALSPEELAEHIAEVEPSMIITSSAGWPMINDALQYQRESLVRNLEKNGKVFVVSSARRRYSQVDSCSSEPYEPNDWQRLLSKDALKSPVVFVGDESSSRTAIILWSSGTTAKSKGVVISHQALNLTVASWFLHSKPGANEQWLGYVPLCYAMGLTSVLLSAVVCGATVYLMPKFNLPTLGEYIERYRITSLMMSPPLAVLLSNSELTGGIDFSSVRSVVSGGASLPSKVMKLLHRRSGMMVMDGYGCSETGVLCCQTDTGPSDLADYSGHVGRPVYGVELKIVAIDNGAKTLMIDEEGEVLARRPTTLSCYLKNETATREAIDDEGWFHTGDVGRIDSQGRLWIKCRVKDIIKVNGALVSPSEIEGVLCDSPLVADAAIAPVFDPQRQMDLPRAFIVAKSTDLAAGPGTPDEFYALGQEIRKWTEKTPCKSDVASW